MSDPVALTPISDLPELVTLSAHGGDFHRFIEALYDLFRVDFIDSSPTVPGRRWSLKRHPMMDGKEATFWHITSEGSTEEERIPELRRSERIRWPRPMIDALTSGSFHCWVQKRKAEKRIVLAVADFSYVVILADRGTYIMLWTAYYVEYNHSRRKKQKEYEGYVGAVGAGRCPLSVRLEELP